LCTIR